MYVTMVTYMLLYIFDLVPRKIPYNRLKRRFYYWLNKSLLSSSERKTKSVLCVSEALEEAADAFFRQWKPNIEVYKIRASDIEKL